MTSDEPEYKNEINESQLAAATFRQPPPRRRGFGLRWIIAGVALVAIAAAFYLGVHPRIEARAALKKETAENNIAAVAVTKPKATSPGRELELPGNMQAFSSAAIYARTNGYLKRWYADIGKRVKAGELLAEIDTPEIDDQLAQAKADTATAEANFKFAESTSQRWEGLLKSDSVSRQEADEKRSDLAAKKAVLDAARYNVNRLEKTQSFKKLYAPFDGIITARNTDIGNLIDSGSGAAKELFRVAATKRLRVFINVPQAYARDITTGLEAELTLPESPGRKVKGTVSRSTESIDAASRTLLVEVDVDNADGSLLPGSYVVVHLKMTAARPAVMLPVNTLLFRPEGTMVAVLQGDKAILTPIKIGRDFGNQVEVLSGVGPNDSIVVNPSDSLVSGAQVRVVEDAVAKTAEAPKPDAAAKPEPPKADAAAKPAAKKE